MNEWKNDHNTCNILTSDPAVNRGTGASGREYQGMTLTVDGLNWVQMRRSQEASNNYITRGQRQVK